MSVEAPAQPAVTAPFVALDRQHEPLLEELHAAFARVVNASSYILGSEVEGFEAEFAALCGTKHCVGVASGTAALTVALIAGGVLPGDEVIVPAHTYIATAFAVAHAGAEPVFCDVGGTDGLIDPGSAAAAITDRTAALIGVHLYGQPCDMDAMERLARRHGLLLVEDAAQAHGASFAGRRAGSLGDVAGFSFYPSKNLGALGDAGAICTDDDVIAARARRLRHLGQHRKGEHLELGFNDRLDGLQAALLRVKLPHLERWNRRRRELADLYRRTLPDGLELLEERRGRECVYHLFPVRHPDRERLERELAHRGVATAVHYSPAVHHQPPFRATARLTVDLRQAERWAREELSLPLFPELSPEEATRIAAACSEATRQGETASSVTTTEVTSRRRSIC